MIPSRAILERSKPVCEAVAWGDGAFRNAVDTIMMEALKLTNTVPVDLCFTGILEPVSSGDGVSDHVQKYRSTADCL